MARTRIFLFMFMTLGVTSVNAQQIVCSSIDSLEFQKRIKKIQEMSSANSAELLVEIGQTFITTSYVAHTLDKGSKEELVINLTGLDCTTFVENALAFTLMRLKQEKSLDQFAQQLTRIRYRQGLMNGYTSRLHYFTEWIADNENKGILEDLTDSLGGELVDTPRTFMSSHREAYPLLADENNFKGLLQIEENLKVSPYHVIPHSGLEALEPHLKTGDILAFATKIDGLDVTHTALAIEKENRIHILHASSTGQVEISELPLLEYIKKIKNSSGLIVARLIPR
ncbi:MAG: DUF1460 domain-containing protein [Eudoraea sp.]|nr:DUF1460 domain-containing protein [Eudoraea sp.]